jgi:hypothetical protein
MVVFVKPVESASTNVELAQKQLMDKLACQMINMEQNRHVYELDTSYASAERQIEPYNQHKAHGIEYETFMNYAILRVYVAPDSPGAVFHTDTDKAVKMLLEHLAYRGRCLTRTCYRANQTKAHTVVSTHVPAEMERPHMQSRIIHVLDPQHAAFDHMSHIYPSDFIWVLVIKGVGCKMHQNVLHIAERDFGAHINVRYLLDSLNTIIYDEYGMFDVVDGHQQIDYPTLQQYTLHDSPRIHKCVIHYDARHSVNLELGRLFTGIQPAHLAKRYQSKKEVRQTLHSPRIRVLQGEPGKGLADAKSVPFYTAEYNCFITGMPLYGTEILLRIVYNSSYCYVLVSKFYFNSNGPRPRLHAWSEYEKLFRARFKQMYDADVLHIWNIEIPERTLEDIIDQLRVRKRAPKSTVRLLKRIASSDPDKMYDQIVMQSTTSITYTHGEKFLYAWPRLTDNAFLALHGNDHEFVQTCSCYLHYRPCPIVMPTEHHRRRRPLSESS